MGNGFLKTALFDQRNTEAVLGNVIARGMEKGVRPQSDAVFPIRRLDIGRSHQAAHKYRRERPQNNFSPPPPPANLHDTPRYQYIQTDLGKIGVAIRPPLLTHLHDANHRYQHAEIPQPAHQKIGSLFVADPNGRGNAD